MLAETKQPYLDAHPEQESVIRRIRRIVQGILREDEIEIQRIEAKYGIDESYLDDVNNAVNPLENLARIICIRKIQSTSGFDALIKFDIQKEVPGILSDLEDYDILQAQTTMWNETIKTLELILDRRNVPTTKNHYTLKREVMSRSVAVQFVHRLSEQSWDEYHETLTNIRTVMEIHQYHEKQN